MAQWMHRPAHLTTRHYVIKSSHMTHPADREADDLDAVWRALSNPIRREILDHLKDGPLITGEIAERFPGLSRFGVMQHLKVLEEADLVLARREGRKRFNHLNPVPIERIYARWVSGYVQPWTQALVGLKQTLEAREEGA